MMMTRIRTLAARFGAVFAFTLFLFLPFSVQAACCVCAPSADLAAKTCVRTTASNCAVMKSQTGNDALKTATCDQANLKEVECAAQSVGGLCPNGPVDEASFGQPVSSFGEQPAAVVPVLNVPIPGLTFSQTLGESQGQLAVPFFAQYVAAAYKYLIGIGAIAAAIMIVYGGFKYIVHSGAPQIKHGKEIITDAVIGLLLLIGAYVILNTINPELLQLNAIRLQRITTEDYKFMTLEDSGFKNAADAEANEAAAANASTGGNAPAIAPQTGENVTIDNIAATGKFTDRLRAYCTAGGGGLGLDYDAKIQNLVRVVLGWKKTCVDEKGCAYYRGGFTNLATGNVVGTALDIPYAIKQIQTFAGKEPTWNSDCATTWDDIKADFYTKRNEPEYKDFVVGGSCYTKIFDQYQQEFADRYEERGIFGGDCGTTIVQMYACAGGQAARGTAATYLSGEIFKSVNRPEGNDVVVWKAKDWNDYVQQVNAAGGLRFGDIFSIGRNNWQHNFMYTGGREDVPFDWFEMGSSGRDGQAGTAVSVGLIAPVGGMAAWPRGTPPDFFLELAKKRGRKASDIFPISVWRPYGYDPCTSKSECKEGQSCHCTSTDTKSSSAFTNNTCSQAFVCHSVKGFGFCTNDEQCPNGQSCKKNSETATSGFCTVSP